MRLNPFEGAAYGGFAERRLDLRKLERKLEIPRTVRVMPNEPYKPRIFISYAHADEPERPAEGEVKWLSFVTAIWPRRKAGSGRAMDRPPDARGDDWEPEIAR